MKKLKDIIVENVCIALEEMNDFSLIDALNFIRLLEQGVDAGLRKFQSGSRTPTSESSVERAYDPVGQARSLAYLQEEDVEARDA